MAGYGAGVTRLHSLIKTGDPLEALGGVIHNLEARGIAFTRLGSGCVVVPDLGGEQRFKPAGRALHIELRHPDDVALLREEAEQHLPHNLRDVPVAWASRLAPRP